MARHQEARGIGDVVLRQRDQRVVPGLGHGRAQLADNLVFHRALPVQTPSSTNLSSSAGDLPARPSRSSVRPSRMIVDPDGEAGQVDQRIDGRGRNAGEPAERRDRNEPVADVFVHVAVIERRRRPDGLVRLAFLACARNVAAVSRCLGGQSGLVEDVEERPGRNAQGFCNRHALGIHRRGRAADRIGEALAIEQEVAAGVLDPPGIHDHALGMEYRVEVRQRRSRARCWPARFPDRAA